MKRTWFGLVIALTLISANCASTGRSAVEIVARADIPAPKFDAAKIVQIHRDVSRDCPRSWEHAHRDGDPERFDFMIFVVQRAYAASGGTVGGNWQRGDVGKLSMDGVTFEAINNRFYFSDTIVGAGGPNPSIGFSPTGEAPAIGFVDPSELPAPFVTCTAGKSPIDPTKPCPVCPLPPVRPGYPGDRIFDTVGDVLQADMREAGQDLNPQSGTWFGRVIYDYFFGGLTIQESIARHRLEWRAILGLP